MKGTSFGTILLVLCMLVVMLLPSIALAESKLEMGFTVLSDLHVEAWDKNSQLKVRKAFQDLQDTVPESAALILNGDLSNGLPDDYDKLKELLKELPHPKTVYATIGNHEFYKAWMNKAGIWNADGFPNGETEQASIERFLQFNGENRVYNEKMVQGYHFLFLGSEQYRQSNPDNLEDAYLSPAQLGWLQQSLKKAQAEGNNKPIFVFLHQPLPNTVSGTTGCCVNNRAIIQHEELQRILSGYPQVIFFTSHTHRELKLPKTWVQNLFTMINTSSVQQPVTDNGQDVDKVLGPDTSEGLYVEVYSDKVIIKGRDFYSQRWIPEANFIVPRVPARTALSKPDLLLKHVWNQLNSFNPAYLETTKSKSFSIGKINWAAPN
jgi:Icc protein